MKNLCCQHCFNEKNITQFIIEKGTYSNSCYYCETENVKAISPEKLFEFIEKVYFGLQEDEFGSSLFDVLNNRFYFFNSNVLDKKQLFLDIVSDNQLLITKKYKTPNSDDIKQSWADFSREIKESNRFFPQNELYKRLFTSSKESYDSSFNLLLESLKKSYSVGRSFFRARLSEDNLDISNMKAPNHLIVNQGRANPVGIPYLYLAENEETCISEVRPSNGCKVNIATFKLTKRLDFLDLSEPRKKAAFFIQESESLVDTLTYVDLLEIFADDLSKPVLPNRSHLDYIPTQFLCEYFKTVCDFDGIIFNSSFGTGKNVVLFNQDLVEGDSMKYLRISNITHKTEEVS